LIYGNKHHVFMARREFTWDDWVGWYDHVAPPIISSYEYRISRALNCGLAVCEGGLRLPPDPRLRKHLRFIEETFGLATLGYADANADDLSDCFYFQQTPLMFQPIAARYDAAYF